MYECYRCCKTPIQMIVYLSSASTPHCSERRLDADGRGVDAARSTDQLQAALMHFAVLYDCLYLLLYVLCKCARCKWRAPSLVMFLINVDFVMSTPCTYRHDTVESQLILSVIGRKETSKQLTTYM